MLSTQYQNDHLSRPNNEQCKSLYTYSPIIGRRTTCPTRMANNVIDYRHSPAIGKLTTCPTRKTSNVIDYRYSPAIGRTTACSTSLAKRVSDDKYSPAIGSPTTCPTPMTNRVSDQSSCLALTFVVSSWRVGYIVVIRRPSTAPCTMEKSG